MYLSFVGDRGFHCAVGGMFLFCVYWFSGVKVVSASGGVREGEAGLWRRWLARMVARLALA